MTGKDGFTAWPLYTGILGFFCAINITWAGVLPLPTPLRTASLLWQHQGEEVQMFSPILSHPLF